MHSVHDGSGGQCITQQLHSGLVSLVPLVLQRLKEGVAGFAVSDDNDRVDSDLHGRRVEQVLQRRALAIKGDQISRGVNGHVAACQRLIHKR